MVQLFPYLGICHLNINVNKRYCQCKKGWIGEFCNETLCNNSKMFENTSLFSVYLENCISKKINKIDKNIYDMKIDTFTLKYREKSIIYQSYFIYGILFGFSIIIVSIIIVFNSNIANYKVLKPKKDINTNKLKNINNRKFSKRLIQNNKQENTSHFNDFY